MRLLPKQLWKEEFQYYSDKSIADLKFEIQQLFNNARGWHYSVNLTGEFTSASEFKMTPKWQLPIIKNYERDLSYLNGQIFTDELNRTRVTFTVRPNSIVLIFFFIFPLFGIMALTSDNIKGDIGNIRMVGWFFTLVMPTIMLVFGHFAKKGIKERFIKTFDLKSIK